MKTIVRYLFIFTILFNFNFVFADVIRCVGNSALLTWNAINVNSCDGVISGAGCSPVGFSNINGSQNVYNSSSNICTATISCTDINGNSLPQQSDRADFRTFGCGTISGTGCTIAVGASTCNATLNWSDPSTYGSLTYPQIVNNSNGSIVSTLNNGSNFASAISFGSTQFNFNNNGANINSTTVSASCAAGSTWNGSTCAAPTATISGTGCTIAVGASTCSGSLTWNITYAANPNIYNSTAGSSFSSSATGNSVAATLTNGNNVFQARNSSTLLNSATLTASCIAGSTWNGSTCAAPTGNFISGPACNISLNNAGCNTTLSWTSSYVSSVNLRDCGGGLYGNYASGARSGAVYVPYNTGCYRIHNAANEAVLDTINVGSDCNGGLAWDGAKCAQPSGSISGTGCTISVNTSTCNGLLTWSTANAGNPRVVNAGTGVTVSTLQSATNFATAITNGSNTFNLNNNTANLANTSINGTCESGTVWTSGVCTHIPMLNVNYTATMTAPRVSFQCALPANSLTLTRTGGAGANLTPGTFRNTVQNINDSTVDPNSSAQTYTYTLTCYKSGSQISQLTQDVNIPTRVYVTDVEDVQTQTGSDVTLKWSSTGDTCNLIARGAAGNWTNTFATTTGVGGKFSYVLDNNVRTELNVSHYGDSALGYKIKCRDSLDARRLTDEQVAIVTTYRRTTASINGPITGLDGLRRIILDCTSDYNRVLINGLTYSGTMPSTKIVNTGDEYTIVCQLVDNNNVVIYQDSAYKKITDTGAESFSLSGFISTQNNTITQGIDNAGPDSTIEAKTLDGRYDVIRYKISDASDWSTQAWSDLNKTTQISSCNKSACTGDTRFRLSSGNSNVTLENDPAYYLNGMLIEIRATSSEGVAKKLSIKLVKTDLDATAKLTARALAFDVYDVTLECTNSTSYTIEYNGTTRSGNIPPAQYSRYSVTMKITATGTGAYMPVVGTCINPSNSDADTLNLPINSNNNAIIEKFTVAPNELVCSGGQVQLSWIIRNARTKNCDITSYPSRDPLQYPEPERTLRASNTEEISNSLVNARTSVNTLVPGTNDAIGSMKPTSTQKYTEKYKLTCGTVSKIVEAKVICQGQQ